MDKDRGMKRFGLSVVFLNILSFCIAATVWEGTAAVSVEGELPEEGLYIATGSLPQNTMVDITNLVNGNTVRVTIMSDLELPGLLALLSPETAERIGLSRVSLARIRMTLSEIEEAVYSSGGAASGGEGDYVITEDDEDAAGYYEDAGYVYDDYTDEDFAPENSVPVAPGPEPPPAPPPAVKSPPQQAPNQGAYEYSLIPAEERPPSAPPPPAPAPPAAPPAQTPRVSAPPVQTPPRASAPPAQPSGYADPRFSVPVITVLERGKYYLQLGSYIAAEVVESELTRIGRMYPLTIQRAEKDGYPFYRILIGPISRGESAALLQRFRDNGYRDAFIRHGN
jgi:hypothetical protein